MFGLQKIFICLFFVCFWAESFAQESPIEAIEKLRKQIDSIQEPLPAPREEVVKDTVKNSNKDTIGKKKKVFLGRKIQQKKQKAQDTDYKIIFHNNDTTFIDTTLTIQKEYKMNIFRKDLFGLLPFHNDGQPMNPLTYGFDSTQIIPGMGLTAKHVGYKPIEAIRYYNVPIPSTEVLYKNGLEQGDMVDGFFTTNFSRYLNMSIAYTGLRSLGSYRGALSSFNNFRFTTSYNTKDKRYYLRLHFASQEILNQQSGGLTEKSVENFITNHEDFKDDRGKMDIVLPKDTRDTLQGKRYYIDQRFKLFSTKKRRKNNITLGHTFVYEKKRFNFVAAKHENYGKYFKQETHDKLTYTKTDNTLYGTFKSPYVLGNLTLQLRYVHLYQGYKNIIFKSNTIIPNRKIRNIYQVGASWRTRLGKFNFNTAAKTNVAGAKGYLLSANTSFDMAKNWRFLGGASLHSRAPDFTYGFLQSNYLDYNWNDALKNINTQNLKIALDSKWFKISADFHQIQNYTYFLKQLKPFKKEENTQGNTPQNRAIENTVFLENKQHKGSIRYLRVHFQNEFKVWKFALDNRFLYQRTYNNPNILNVPKYVARSSFYFSETLFKKKSLFLQTGFTLYYFSKYYANDYNPVVGDFVVQNSKMIGNHPVVDFFANGLIRQTRLFGKISNVFGLWSEKRYFSAPRYPARDFTITFGLVWNFKR